MHDGTHEINVGGMGVGDMVFLCRMARMFGIRNYVEHLISFPLLQVHSEVFRDESVFCITWRFKYFGYLHLFFFGTKAGDLDADLLLLTT